MRWFTSMMLSEQYMWGDRGKCICACTGHEASQGDLTRLGEAAGLPAMVGAAAVKIQHFASTRSVAWAGAACTQFHSGKRNA